MAVTHLTDFEPVLPLTKGQIDATHHQLHSIENLPDISPDQMAAMGRVLCRSVDFDHVLDSGWAFMQAGAELHDEELVQHSLDILDGVVRHTEDTPMEIAARIPGVIAPEYMKIAHGELPDARAVSNRLLSVNERVLKLRTVDIREASGIAPEVATLYLLNRHFSAHPDRYPGVLAWPASPWQDNRKGPSRSNFDIMVGANPHDGIKVQVKNQLEPTRWNKDGHKQNGDVLLRRWRKQYDKDIFLVFGDVHLGNPSNKAFAINSAIHSLHDPVNQRIVRIATRNLLDELRIAGGLIDVK